jgi:hypothetical protein
MTVKSRMSVEQALVEVARIDAQCRDLTARTITNMGSLLVKCYRQGRPPTIEEIELVGFEALPRPRLVTRAVHDALS